MRRKFLLLLTAMMTACFIFGVGVVVFSAESTCVCVIAVARDDNESEYRILLSGEGITDGSFDDAKVKINNKTLKAWKEEGKIREVFSDGLAGENLVRIDLPDFASGILNLDGTDTVTVLDGFKVGAGGTAQVGDYVKTLSEMKAPSVDYGFAENIEIVGDVLTATNGTLEFTPVFSAGSGESVQNVFVKLNGTPLKADDSGKYIAELNYGTSVLLFHAENAALPNVFVEKKVTVCYSDTVVEGPAYVSYADFTRNAEGRPSFKDRLSIRFSNVVPAEDRAKLELTVNGRNLSSLGADAAVVWLEDGRQADVKTLFFQEGSKNRSGIYKYDGSDEVTVGGVTAETNTLKITSDGQVYNVTKGEKAPEYRGEGCVSVQKIQVERDHEAKRKDAIHIFFNENVDIKGAAAISEGVLLFNTGTVLINGYNLQTFWDANNGTCAYWVNAENPYVRIDVYYDGVSKELWDRNGENVVRIDASFITMTNLGLGKGFGDYVYDPVYNTVYAQSELPEEIPFVFKDMLVKKEAETGNDWIQFRFDREVWQEARLNVQENKNITDNILFNNRPLSEIKSELSKCEIHAGADGAGIIRITISSANDHSDLKKLLKADGSDQVVLRKGLGFNRYQSVKQDVSVKGLADAFAPVITLEKPEKTLHDALFEIKFTVVDDSEYTVVVMLNGAEITPKDGKYVVTLAEGVNTVAVAVTDKSVLGNSAVEIAEIVYEEVPVISVSGIKNDSTVKIPEQKITVSVNVGRIHSVKMGETTLTAGQDGRYAFTLAEGENIVLIEAINGGTKSSLSIKVTLDTKAPEIIISAKEETVSAAEYVFTVTASDAKTLVVKVNGESIAVGENGYSVTLKEGQNEIFVSATDAAGNTETKSLTVTYVPVVENSDAGGCGASFTAISLSGAFAVIAVAALSLRKKRK